MQRNIYWLIIYLQRPSCLKFNCCIATYCMCVREGPDWSVWPLVCIQLWILAKGRSPVGNASSISRWLPVKLSLNRDQHLSSRGNDSSPLCSTTIWCLLLPSSTPLSFFTLRGFFFHFGDAGENFEYLIVWHTQLHHHTAKTESEKDPCFRKSCNFLSCKEKKNLNKEAVVSGYFFFF